VEIVREFEKRSTKIQLLEESERNGKSASINHFIAVAKSAILIIESADTIPSDNTVEKMVSVFMDEQVGMSGGRPIPVNKNKGFITFAVQLLWRLHHEMALVEPKLGEMVAFRKLFDSIPAESAVDEASIQAKISQAGLKTLYVPEALIYNKGPENLRDFIKQRRRIEAGHIWLKHKHNYEVSSQNKSLILKLAWKEAISNPGEIPSLIGVILLEMWCRLLGKYDFFVKKTNPYIWDIAESTKELNRK
ncbi:MAG: glycosyltransferase, partial [Candidatus Cloacimonetes bacterium]|nr:glycosyltransferase [Candidatus Cloacimonadota bacterium]